MISRQAPRLALALLERLVPNSAPLAGDLVEEFERHQSSVWLWWEVLAAVAIVLFERPVEIRPLHLVDLQPVDAIERTRRMGLRFRPVNLSASPLSGVGGLGLAALGFLVTSVAPATWWALLVSTIAGALAGIVIIVVQKGLPTPVTTIRLRSTSAT
jgi:F0F1-type ATP synthase assembly protein I